MATKKTDMNVILFKSLIMGNIKNNEKADKSFISKTVLICSL